MLKIISEMRKKSVLPCLILKSKIVFSKKELAKIVSILYLSSPTTYFDIELKLRYKKDWLKKRCENFCIAFGPKIK